MKLRSLFAIAFLTGIALQSACSRTRPVEPLSTDQSIVVSTITDLDLPASYPDGMTYHADYHVTDPESLLTALIDEGVQVQEAWQPLDDHCFDPIGPHFTVVIVGEWVGASQSGFRAGEGRLACSQSLLHYSIEP